MCWIGKGDILYQLICRGKTTGLSSESARWSCDNCQQMSDFDSCQSNSTHTDGLHSWKVSEVVQDLLRHLTSGYMRCVYGWAGGRRLRHYQIVYHILLLMVLRCARLERVRASLQRTMTWRRTNALDESFHISSQCWPIRIKNYCR